MKISQILSILIAFAAVASAVPNTFENAKRQEAKNPVDEVVKSTGWSVRTRFLNYIPEDIGKERMDFFLSVHQGIWQELADLENKLTESAKANKADAALANQIGNAWMTLFNGKVPDFKNLSTEPPK
ncbi:hypothetical protein TWF730_009164 [Orbilia blumenaviensis]|uniref:Uncharacterized protein n=1 Tax=Orbilia blumenaviensis TaxID=1796055 RepID=A0AAV9UYE8_9PEZI